MFECYIKLFNWDGASDAYALACAQHLNTLSDATVLRLCEASIRYYHDFLDMIGEAPREFAQPREILKLIQPSSLSVPNPKDSSNPNEHTGAVVHLELNCDWEEEHGLEWLVRNNKVLYVGAYNGVNPWGPFEPKKRWNYT